MSLDRFREIADEKTAHLSMTPQMQAKILASLSSKRPMRIRFAVLAAAACLMVMALSAGALALGNGNAWFASQPPALEGALSQEGLLLADVERQGEGEIGLQLVSGKNMDVYMLTHWERTGDTVITPQQGDNGLWGYVDETGEWIVEPVFAEANPVNGISARVVDEEGTAYTILFE